jgi:hypothetical protein
MMRRKGDKSQLEVDVRLSGELWVLPGGWKYVKEKDLPPY